MIWIFPDIAYCLFLIHMHVSDLWQLAGLFLILLLHMSNKGWHFFRNPQTSNKLLQLQRKRAESCHQGEIIKSRGEIAKRRKRSSHGLQPTYIFFFGHSQVCCNCQPSATQQIPAPLAVSELLWHSEVNLKLAYVARCSFSSCRGSLWKDGEGHQMDTCGATIACLSLPGSWGRRGHFTGDTHSDFHKRQSQMRKYHPVAKQALRGQP